jgi:hypothetical protein
MICCLLSVVAIGAGRGSARRPPHFLLLRQEKVSKEKATRVRVSLRCAKGNLRCSRRAGNLQTRLAPQTCSLLHPPAAALLGTRTRDGRGTSPRFASVCVSREAFSASASATATATTTQLASTQSTALSQASGSSLPSRWCEAPAAAPRSLPPRPPLCLRRAAQRSADPAGRMFEPAGRVCGQPALCEQRRLPRRAAAGSQTPGSPSLCLLSLGEARESEVAAGPRPGLPRNHTTH